MIHDGQKLHVRVSQPFQVVRQLRRQLAIGQRAIAFFGHPPPGANVHFVNRHGLIESVTLTARCHPFLVAPLMIEIPHDGSRLRRYLIENRKRIRFVHAVVVKTRNDVVLIESSFTDSRNKISPRFPTFRWAGADGCPYSSH